MKSVLILSLKELKMPCEYFSKIQYILKKKKEQFSTVGKCCCELRYSIPNSTKKFTC